MGTKFDRCIYCFAVTDASGACPVCGYENGLCDFPGWWLPPGTILKGRYVVGRYLNGTSQELCYLGWDLDRELLVEVVEYFPESMVTRDITHSEDVICRPGREREVEAGKQAFFEKAKLFYHCVSRVEGIWMDFFTRNDTCYYVRKRRQKSPQQG